MLWCAECDAYDDLIFLPRYRRASCLGRRVETGAPCKITFGLNERGYCKYHDPGAPQCRAIAAGTGKRCKVTWDLNKNMLCDAHAHQDPVDEKPDSRPKEESENALKCHSDDRAFKCDPTQTHYQSIGCGAGYKVEDTGLKTTSINDKHTEGPCTPPTQQAEEEEEDDDDDDIDIADAVEKLDTAMKLIVQAQATLRTIQQQRANKKRKRCG